MFMQMIPQNRGNLCVSTTRTLWQSICVLQLHIHLYQTLSMCIEAVHQQREIIILQLHYSNCNVDLSFVEFNIIPTSHVWSCDYPAGNMDMKEDNEHNQVQFNLVVLKKWKKQCPIYGKSLDAGMTNSGLHGTFISCFIRNLS